MENKIFKSINWNAVEDSIDKATWEKLTEQFWLDTRVPISNDLNDWENLSQKERDLYNHVLMGLTALDTLQSEDGNEQLKNDVRTKHENAVLSNIQFMECLTTGHYLLTPSGWLDISEIKIGDLVLQYNEDGTSEFQKVLNKSSHLPKKLYRFHNKKFDIKVSGGHRMVYEKMSQTNKENGWNLEVMTAKDYMTAPNTYYKRNILHNKGFNSDCGENSLSHIEKLIIAIQADGSINKERFYSDNINRIDVRFSFVKQSKINELSKIVSQIEGVSIKEVSSDKRDKNKRNFSVNMDKDVLRMFDNEKNFEDYFDLSTFTQEKSDKFIAELSKWDSHISDKFNNDIITYYTCNEKNSKFVQAVATLSSWYYTINTRKDDRKETYKDSYIVRFTNNPSSAYYGFQSKTTKEEIEPEMVYGVEVPSSYLVVMTPKGLMITGNCVHAKSYSSIFSTLCSKKQIEEIFEWGENNQYLQYKAKTIQDIYLNGTPLQKKVASVFLESFLFYSGFYTPLYYVGMGQMSSVAEVIKLILRDESVHGTSNLNIGVL